MSDGEGCAKCGAARSSDAAVYCALCGALLPVSNASYFNGAAALEDYVETSPVVVGEEQAPSDELTAEAEPEETSLRLPRPARWIARLRRPRAEALDTAELELTASGDEAEPTLPVDADVEEQRPKYARWIIWASAGLVGVIVGAGFGIAGLASSSAQHAPIASPSSTSPRLAGISGWSESASWSDARPATSVVVSSDGERFATIVGDKVTVRDQDGTRTAQELVDAKTQLLAGPVDGKPALLALTGTQLLVWTEDMTTSTTWTVPGESARIATLGAGVVVTTADRQSYVVTGGGLAPYTSPRPGAAALAVTSDGAIQWASARGEVLTAAATGSVVRQIALAAPLPGASVSRWLAGGEAIALIWTLPDGSTTLATHSAADGSVIASAPVDAAAAADRLVLSASSTMAMFRAFHIDLTTGWIGVPDQEFVASVALGESFFGATGPTTAVLSGDAVIAAKRTPTIVPVGVTANGSLVATVQGAVAIFPKTPAE